MIRYARRLLAKTATKCGCFRVTLAHRASGKKYIKLFVTILSLEHIAFLRCKQAGKARPWMCMGKYSTHPYTTHYYTRPHKSSKCRRCKDCANLRQTLWIFLLADGKGTNSYEPQKIHRGHVEKPKEGENYIA